MHKKQKLSLQYLLKNVQNARNNNQIVKPAIEEKKVHVKSNGIKPQIIIIVFTAQNHHQ